MRFRGMLLGTLAGLLSISAWPSSAYAQKFEVQPALQAALFKKIILMTMKATDAKPTVLVVFDGQHQDDASSMAKALEDLGLTLQFSRNGQIPADLSSVRAAFLSAPNDAILKALADAGVLTVSGYRDMVASGKASLTIVNEGGKPKPMINRGRLNAEKKSDLFTTLQAVALIVE